MLWTKGFDTTGATFTHFQALAKLRKTYLALRKGDTHVVWSTDHVASEGDAGLFAFERTGGDAGPAYALVVLDTSDGHPIAGQVLTTTQPAGTVLVDLLAPERPTYTVGAGGALSVTLPVQSAMILVPQQQVQP